MGWGTEKGREESEGKKGSPERKTEGIYSKVVLSNLEGHTPRQGGLTVFKSATSIPLPTLACSAPAS